MVALSTVLLPPLATRLASGLIDGAKKPFGALTNELKIQFKSGFEDFFTKQITRFSQVRTILASHTPLRLEDVYINLSLGFGQTSIEDDDLLEVLPKQKRIVITATAGAGKSMLMRYTYFIYLQNQRNVLPVFIELRELNDTSSGSLVDLIIRRLSESMASFSESYLRAALERGTIALFLDGYDEIDHDQRHQRGREIIRLADQFPETLFLLSGRPDEAFKGWTTFTLFYLQSLTEMQVRLLIEKIPYDLTIKAIFFKKLDAGLYLTHREFLTNPLLTVMMLITLEQFADVPAKVHLFYEYAFEALFARHDVTKGGFQRKRYVAIALDDYRRLFSYFCAITYMRQSFSFSETTALECLGQAVLSSQITVRQDEMLNDLAECTCMLAREGLDFVFSHRSFQEYFVAYFLSRIKVEEFPRVAPKLIARADMDNVFLMISEMNQEKFEESWALPTLETLTGMLEDDPSTLSPLGFVRKIFETGAFNFIHGTIGFHALRSNEIMNQRMALYRCYGVFEGIHERLLGLGIDMSRETPDPVFEAIKEGSLLADDARFLKLRETGEDTLNVEMQDGDNTWFQNSRMGVFITLEREELFALKDRVSERVRNRREGLKSILSIT